MTITNDEYKLEGKYQILKDKQHESVIHWTTRVVIFGFKKLQFNSYQFAFKYLFIYLFVYLFINYNTLDNLCNTSHVCMSRLKFVYVGGGP